MNDLTMPDCLFTDEFNALRHIHSRLVEERALRRTALKTGRGTLVRNRELIRLLDEAEAEARRLLSLAYTDGRVEDATKTAKAGARR